MTKTLIAETQILSDSDVNIKSNATSNTNSILLQKKLSLLTDKSNSETNQQLSKKSQGPTSGKYFQRIFQDTLQTGREKSNR